MLCSSFTDVQVILAIAQKRYIAVPIGGIGAYLRHSGVVGFFKYNFATGPGITGWVMWAALGTMAFFARDKVKKVKFER